MTRMAGRREARQADDGVADRADVAGGDGGKLAPELVEGVPVEPPGARLEPLRVDDVRETDLGDVHREPWVLAYEDACRAGVIEMDVRKQQMADIAELDPACAERVAERGNARRRAAVEKGEAVVGLDEVHADPSGVAEVEEVERLVCHARDARWLTGNWRDVRRASQAKSGDDVSGASSGSR